MRACVCIISNQTIDLYIIYASYSYGFASVLRPFKAGFLFVFNKYDF